MGEEDDEQGEDLEGHAHDPDGPATQAFRYNRHGTPGKDSDGLLGCEDTSGHSKGQASVNGDGHDQHVENVVPHAPPVMDADEIPEGSGALCLLEEDAGPYLCSLISLGALDWLVSDGAKGSQTYLGRAVVEEPDQEEQYHPAGNARNPEDQLHSEASRKAAPIRSSNPMVPMPWKDQTMPMATPKYLLNQRVTPDTGSTLNGWQICPRGRRSRGRTATGWS